LKGLKLKDTNSLGFNDEWPTEGPYMEVLDWHGLTGLKIAEKVVKWLKY